MEMCLTGGVLREGQAQVVMQVVKVMFRESMGLFVRGQCLGK